MTLLRLFERGRVGMPWKDRTVMDERIRFVARLLEGKMMALYVESSIFPARRVTRSLIVTRSVAWRGSRPHAAASPLWQSTAGAGRTAIHSSKYSKRENRTGERARSDFRRRRAPSTPCSTAMVWSNACGTDADARRAPPYRWDSSPTNSGAPTTKASSVGRNIATR